ncbi:MAG: hypothetical protein Harvfovirus3_71 [Harvfovirus sp.]|uniref:Uncharacterized protein n=1 Tax=Harvfovirus sp. TaxID=2487768 RepID=A0A3G5A070_9VIRU|nr:MAG: hypothetical protein Harvfovirus3_71 [Harvfovirus sp.]
MIKLKSLLFLELNNSHFRSMSSTSGIEAEITTLAEAKAEIALLKNLLAEEKKKGEKVAFMVKDWESRGEVLKGIFANLKKMLEEAHLQIAKDAKELADLRKS